jgi:hypothetical protein
VLLAFLVMGNAFLITYTALLHFGPRDLPKYLLGSPIACIGAFVLAVALGWLVGHLIYSWLVRNDTPVDVAATTGLAYGLLLLLAGALTAFVGLVGWIPAVVFFGIVLIACAVLLSRQIGAGLVVLAILMGGVTAFLAWFFMRRTLL